MCHQGGASLWKERQWRKSMMLVDLWDTHYHWIIFFFYTNQFPPNLWSKCPKINRSCQFWQSFRNCMMKSYSLTEFKPGGYELISPTLIKRFSHLQCWKCGTFIGLAADIGTWPMMYLFEHRSLIVVGFETMGRCNAESVSLYELGKDPVTLKLPS